jgi:hypothetical protein
MRGKATCWSRRENRMIVMSILGLVVVVVLLLGLRYDRKQRRLRLGDSGGSSHGSIRLEEQTRADKWGGPGL